MAQIPPYEHHADRIVELHNQGLQPVEIVRALGAIWSEAKILLVLAELRQAGRIADRPAAPATTTPATARTCQWIEGDPGSGRQWRMCGQAGWPWCAEHKLRVYPPRNVSAA